MSDPYDGEVTLIERPRAVTVPAGDVTNAEFTDHENRITTLEGAQAGQLDDLSDVDTSTAAPSTGDLLQFNGTAWVPYTPAAITVRFALPFVLDGNGAAIATGVWYDEGILLPTAATVAGWVIDANGAITVTVQQGTPSGGSVTYSAISGTEKPTLAAAGTASDFALTTWTTALPQYRRLRVSVDSAAATFATVHLLLDREIGP